MRRCGLALCLLAMGCARGAAIHPADSPDAPWISGGEAAAAAGPFCPHRTADPPGLVLERPCGTPLATFTDGARTVLLAGPERRFFEPSAPAGVRSTAWVRVLGATFGGSLDDALTAWLESALRDPSPDVLAMAMQYLDGAPPVVVNGLQIAGDAFYGPLSDLGLRVEGADFNDYLGIRWTYPDGTVDHPQGDMLHSMDCSGYMRMIWGYRNNVPLAHGPSNDALPRRAVQMDMSTFGVTIIANAPDAAAHLDRLQAGDLLLFDADPTDGPAVDHVGMFLGRDEAGHPRFISSRKGANGPTLGDDRGASVLDGHGLYALAFRAARRL